MPTALRSTGWPHRTTGLPALSERPSRDDLYALAEPLADAAEELRSAAAADRAESGPDLLEHTQVT
jgi:hypothetical protein